MSWSMVTRSSRMRSFSFIKVLILLMPKLQTLLWPGLKGAVNQRDADLLFMWKRVNSNYSFSWHMQTDVDNDISIRGRLVAFGKKFWMSNQQFDRMSGGLFEH